LSREYLKALLEALLVTFLWSSSYILVKIGLNEIAPMTLVALRYITASIILVPLAIRKGLTLELHQHWPKFILLGFLGYAIAQGMQCVGLSYLPAVSVTFILNFTPLIILTLDYLIYRETPTKKQLVGVILVITGAYLYFNENLLFNPTGFAVTLISGVGWATYLILSKRFFKNQLVSPLSLTAFSMAAGTAMMSLTAYLTELPSEITLKGLTIILWLGLVNTAIAFFLWNRALQKLPAFEISILQNTMLIQIALMAWIILGEPLSNDKILAIILVFTGVLITQLQKAR
jgi:drug/metabolite transporter (DMT)-like permease